MNFNQENNAVPSPAFYELDRRVKEIEQNQRAMRLSSSPTVQVNETAIGTTLEAAPPATPTSQTRQVWL